MAVLAVRNLSFTYPEQSARAVNDVSFSLEKGEFAVLCGATGSGKSTLMRLLKRELQPIGTKEGEILINGQALDTLDTRTSAGSIGYVMQRPEQQLVTDKVWHELAFGPENMGLPTDAIRRRVSEMASYFGIEEWFEKSTAELSGGQKQLLNLAAVMVMQPQVLLLDEPTAQLDPIAASEFIHTVYKLNRDFSLTVLMIEHRLEEVVPLADTLLVLKNGSLQLAGTTRSCAAKVIEDNNMLAYMPAAVQLYARFKGDPACPLTVREGRRYIEEHFSDTCKTLPVDEPVLSDEEALSFDNVYFRYGRALPDVLRGLDFKVHTDEIFCILGGNGSGKSTALSVAAGISKPYAGTVRVFGKKLQEYKNQSLYRNCLTLLPQDVQTVFLCNTVREELKGIDASGFPFDLSPFADMHPYDLSGGQQQLLALAKVLGTKPRLLLLDEPTKGLDAETKAHFAEVCHRLKESGMTIVCVTHDVEFAASVADRCAMFFRGGITSCDVPRRFFSDNSFYTTAASRMTRGRYENVATVSDAIEILSKNTRKVTV